MIRCHVGHPCQFVPLVELRRMRNTLGSSFFRRSRFTSIWVAWLVIVASTVASADSPLRPNRVGGEVETRVDVPQSLASIHKQGGIPTSLGQLDDLQRQHQTISQRVGAVTVNVAIGAAQGCGVIVTPSGYVLTAAHVGMRPGKTAIITFSNGRTAKATTLGMNRSVDAGLMKIDDGQNDGKPWPFATMGRSENLVEGMWCIASGHPGGFDLQRGPVTRVGRILKVRDDSIVTDCALIGGDSGGPLFDIGGRLIAIHSRIGNDVADNLHIPVQHFEADWDRLASSVAWGYLPGFRPVLGVRGDPKATLARIEFVKLGSPAEAAGVRTGDVIEQFGDITIQNFGALTVAVADTMPGELSLIHI